MAIFDNLVGGADITPIEEAIESKGIEVPDGATAEEVASLISDNLFIKTDQQIPIMTSNTAPRGVVSASSNYNSDLQPYKAVNSDYQTGWSSASGSTAWWKYEFPLGIIPKSAYLYNNLGGATTTVVIQGSNNNANWDDLCSPFSFAKQQHYRPTINNPQNKKYKYIRVHFTMPSSSGNANLSVFQICDF